MKQLKNMFKQAQQMQQQLTQVQSQLEEHAVTGTAGGGVVTVIANGKGLLQRVTIDPTLLVPAESDVLEDLLVAAVNDAKSKADALGEQMMSGVTSGLNLPGDFKLPF